MAKKIRVGVLFGGKSAEHEISLISTKNIVAAMDPGKYEIVLIGIDKNGEWHLRNAARFLANVHDPKQVAMDGEKERCAVIPQEDGKMLVSLAKQGVRQEIDVIFPVLHGTYGEDGTVQGLMKLVNIPFVGAGVLGSAIGMDKDVSKRLLRDAKVPVAKFITVPDSARSQLKFAQVKRELGLTLFIKPCNLGSSVGVSKVKNEAQFQAAVDLAFTYDRKILIEEFIEGREFECSVLGNDKPIASLPAEVIPKGEFYSYDAKYVGASGTVFDVPAKLPAKKAMAFQALSIKAYQVLCCEGMARVDFLMNLKGKIYVNEINTIPGFTDMSLYPHMWLASGMTYPQIVDRLIELALERHEKESRLKTTY